MLLLLGCSSSPGAPASEPVDISTADAQASLDSAGSDSASQDTAPSHDALTDALTDTLSDALTDAGADVGSPDGSDDSEDATDTPMADGCAANPTVTSAAGLGAIVECVQVGSLYLELCNGAADEVVLPALTTVTGNLQACLDAGDVLKTPKLETAKVIVVWFDHGDADVHFGDGQVSEALIIGANLAGLTLTVKGLTSAATLQVDGDGIAASVAVPDLTSLGSIGIAEGTDELVLASVQVVTGDIAPYLQFFSFLEMPELVTVHGSVTLSGLEVGRFLAPKLTTVGGNLALPAGPFAAAPSFGALETVGGDLRLNFPQDCDFAPCTDLGQGPGVLTFPALASVAGELSVTNLSSLSDITLPGLQSLGALTLSGNITLETLGFPALNTVGEVTIIDNTALPNCLAELVVQAASPTGTVSLSGNREGCICSRAAGEPDVTCE